jgi:hypothetical protein
VKFRSDVSGRITGIRFYTKGSAGSQYPYRILVVIDGNAAGKRPRFQNEDGEWLATNDSFPTPVPIVANTTYVASYHTGGGYYVFWTQFQNAGVDNSTVARVERRRRWTKRSICVRSRRHFPEPGVSTRIINWRGRGCSCRPSTVTTLVGHGASCRRQSRRAVCRH